MKKKLFRQTLILLMIIGCIAALSGCGATPAGTEPVTTEVSEPVALDLNAISNELSDGNVFGDAIEPIDTSYIEMLMKIAPTDYTTAIINMSSGATAERLALFEAADNTAALALKDKCDQHIAEQVDAYAGYMPAEVDKLNNAIVAVYDKYVVLCVAENYTGAGVIIKKYFK